MNTIHRTFGALAIVACAVGSSAMAQAKIVPQCAPVSTATCDPQGNPLNPATPPPLGNAAGSSASATSTTGKAALVPLTYGLLSTVLSQQSGLGNISDPALIQLADGSLRMFFLNGNEQQAGISGYDNLVHSLISTDNGKSWVLESGVRMSVQSPVSVNAINGAFEGWGWYHSPSGDQLTHFTSTNGKDFTSAGAASVSTSTCKNSSGASASRLGDPQMVKVASGYLAFAHDAGSQTSPPFTRFVCALTSSDGNTWAIDAGKTISLSTDIQTNPETYRNRSGVIEQILPIDTSASGGRKMGMQVRTSTNDGATWSSLSELSFFAADPDRLDVANGDSLLAFGNFDSRKGGLLAVTKKVTTKYKASRVTSGQTGVVWTISGAKKTEIKVKNLCLGTDVTSKAKIAASGSYFKVTYSDATSSGCVYAVIGAIQAIQ
jgi:hypothetical protein